MLILSMKRSGAKRGGSSATPMDHPTYSRPARLATPPGGDHLASRSSAA